MPKRYWVAGMVALAITFAVPAAAQAAATESLVNVGSQSPSAPFPQNKQNEPAIAVDPNHPDVLAAGSNDEIDEPPCAGNDCPFAQGIGNSGIYFSFNGGTSWIQPTYQGFSGRSGTLGTGDIGTLPHYDTAGLVSDGDPGVAFGPSPNAQGNFSWSNGSRLYYSNLTSNFSTVRSDQTFKGFEAIAVSHTDKVRAAANNDASAWSDPTVVTQQQSQTTFSDKPDITADNAATSPHFGNVYVCYSQFKSQQVNGPEPIQISRSTDGGVHFSNPQSLTASHNGGNAGQGNNGRQGCNVRTDSHGNVYVVWEDTVQHHSVISLATSTDGGVHYSQPQVIADVTDVGIFDGVRSISFDGIAGARTSSFPSLSIANGAPSGAGAPNTIAVGWSNGALNQEHALVTLSANGGSSWSTPTAVEDQGVTPADRPDFAFLGISPDGQDLYVTYDGFRDRFQNDTTSDRQFVGVVRHADVTEVAGTPSLSNLSTLDRGAVGDGRASSANALIDEFIGDYNSVAATNTGAVAVYNDARNAAVCTKINTFRQATVNGDANAVAPAPATDCPPDRGRVFGNTDIFSAAVTP